MKFKIYSIYDSKVGAYFPPVFYKSRGEFLRAFSEAVADPKSNLCKYPSDFTAFELGTWDDDSGAFELHEAKISLGLALEFKAVLPDPRMLTPSDG